LPAKFAMVITPASTPPAPQGEDEPGAAGMAARIASGPGFWTEWLAELDRQGLLEELLAEDVIARALREAPPGHKYDRVLTAKMTVICVLVACLFPGAGYDTVLATAFGLPGLRSVPGAEIPSGSAFSQARKLLGEQVMQRLFELDAAVTDADLGIGLRWKGLEVTAIDGTKMELDRNDVLEDGFGTPADGARPLLRVTAHVRTATFRWISAAIGGYHDGENALADQLEDSFRPGILNLADRGFFSMHRWIRFSAAGADLAWRIKNGARSVPLKTIRTLPDGSELVMLHESDGMRTRRRNQAGDPRAERLPDTTARLVTFTITTRTRSGQAQDHPDAGADHPAGSRGIPGPRDRSPVCREMANRNRVPSPEANRPRLPQATARPVPRTRPPGSLGTPAHPQHRGHRHRPRRRIRRARPPAHPVHRRPRPRPLPRRRRRSLPALRTPPRQRRYSAGQPGRRHPRPAPPPARTPADIRQDRRRTTNQAHRRSHLHHRHHNVESPEMGSNSENLRAVGARVMPKYRPVVKLAK
jgi:Insertion element 4 transposase N-terminal